MTGAGGGVGTHAVQIGRLAGARVVAITTSADKEERIRALGADEVVVVARGQEWSGEVKKLTDGRGAEVVIEGVGSATFPSSFRALAKGGRLVFVGEISGQPAQFNAALMIYKEAWFTGAQSANAEELTQVLNLVASGGIQPVIGEVLPLAEAARAHQILAEQTNFGRVVLAVGWTTMKVKIDIDKGKAPAGDRSGEEVGGTERPPPRRSAPADRPRDVSRRCEDCQRAPRGDPAKPPRPCADQAHRHEPRAGARRRCGRDCRATR